MPSLAGHRTDRDRQRTGAAHRHAHAVLELPITESLDIISQPVEATGSTKEPDILN